MHVETIDTQGRFGGGSFPIRRNRFDRPLSDLRLIVERAQVPCSWCDRPIMPRTKGKHWLGRRWAEHYDSPWDESSREDFYCSEECCEYSEDSSYSDYSYQYCEGCGRSIVERCPSNGWHEYFRYDEDGAVCLRCYKESIIDDGQPEEDFIGDTIKGGMFFDESELAAAGYERLEEAFISMGEAASVYNDKAQAYIASGYQLVTAFQSMAIGGLEGSIELWGVPRGLVAETTWPKSLAEHEREFNERKGTQ